MTAEDHQPRQAASDHPFVKDSGDGRPDEDALVEQEVDFETRRQARQNFWHQLAHLVYDRQGRGAAVAQDGKQGGVAPVAPHQVRLGIKPVVDERDLSDIHHRPIHVADGDVVQVVQDHRAAIERDIVLARPDLRRTGRQDDVLGQDRIGDVLGRQPPRVERVGVDVDVHDAHLAAVGHRDGRALNGDELGADEAVAQVIQLLLGELLAAQARQHHRNAGGIVLDDQRRRDARR